MLEVCFNRGVSGCLKCAQHPSGSGAHVAAVFGWDENGNPPTKEEIEAHLRKVQEEHEKSLAEMIPLGGNGGDVFDFPLALHIGDISAEVPMEVLKQSDMAEMPHPLKKGLGYCEFVAEELERLLSRVEHGEEIRIWYSSCDPADVCGLCWFLWLLKGRNLQPHIWLMNLPEYLEREDGSMVISRGWGEIEPEKYGSYLYLQKRICAGFFAWGVMTWEKLRKENAPLRAVINGKISSAAVDFYDPVICMALEGQPECFKEAQLIGYLLCESCLSVMGDGFIHERLLSMVEQGKLAIVSAGENGSYRGQILRKNRT